MFFIIKKKEKKYMLMLAYICRFGGALNVFNALCTSFIFPFSCLQAIFLCIFKWWLTTKKTKIDKVIATCSFVSQWLAVL